MRAATIRDGEILVEQHPDAVRADFSVNEGGGDRVELGGKVLYLCATAEKMSSPFLLRVHGRSGHASMPSIADNALVKAAPLIERLGAFRAEPRLIPEVEGFLAALLGKVPAPDDAVTAAHAIARASVSQDVTMEDLRSAVAEL